MNQSRNTDPLEFASDLQEELNKKGLAQVRQAMTEQHHPDFDGKHCLDCGDNMPQARLDAKRIRCTQCQETKDSRSRLFRR